MFIKKKVWIKCTSMFAFFLSAVLVDQLFAATKNNTSCGKVDPVTLYSTWESWFKEKMQSHPVKEGQGWALYSEGGFSGFGADQLFLIVDANGGGMYYRASLGSKPPKIKISKRLSIKQSKQLIADFNRQPILDPQLRKCEATDAIKYTYTRYQFKDQHIESEAVVTFTTPEVCESMGKYLKLIRIFTGIEDHLLKPGKKKTKPWVPERGMKTLNKGEGLN